jgi:hypothetical protein
MNCRRDERGKQFDPAAVDGFLDLIDIQYSHPAIARGG